MRVLIVLCCLFTLFSVEAQKKIVLSGIVVNAESEALVGANVALYNATDSTLITGKASDAKGAFKIDCKLINRCYLQISFLGYKTQRLGLVNVYENQEFGKIILETNEVMTDEVQIIASQQVQELDRMIVYPDRIQVKQSATPLDLLANMMLPGLDVNTVERTATALDKAVEFRINGRKVNVKDVDALIASNIQKVEYIDNPGLEYGKGAGAVVNYVTKKPIAGFSTSGSLLNAVWVGFGNDFLNMRWNHKRSEIGVSYNTMFRKYKKRSNDQTNQYFFPDQTEILREYMGENTPFKSQEHNLNISYSLMKEKDYLFSVIGRMAYKYNEKNYLANIYENGAFSSRQGSERSTRDILPELDIYLSKQITPRQGLSVNVVGGYVSSDLDYWYEEEERDRYFTSFSADGSRYNLIGELKYNDRFSKNHSLSIGIKESHFWEEDRYSNESGVRETDNNYLYAYAQLAGNFNKFIYNAGVSGAMSRYSQLDRNFTFWSFQPAISLGYRFSKTSLLRYNFELSSEDPLVAYLNDVVQVVNPYLQSQGNRNLSAYNTYKNSLVYSFTHKKLNLQLSGYHYYMDNPVTDHIYYDDKAGMFINSYLNQGYMQRYFLMAYGRYSGLFNNILTLSARLRYSHYKTSGENYRHHLNTFSASFQANINYKDFSLLLTADTRDKYLMGERLEYRSLSSIAMLQYSKKHFIVGLGLYYPFAKQWDAGSDLLSSITRQKSWTTIKDNGRMLFVRLSWNFFSGRKYKSGKKSLNNEGGMPGLSTMPVID